MGLNPAEVSNQVFQRDRHAEYVQLLALIAATLEKIAPEIEVCNERGSEIEEPFGKPRLCTKGSSNAT
ncbi:MAG: hypothetical protein Ct9H300mP19_20760 [Dehalococcoidia bacterium]|nr:MAG: hypothetical protein Ct9H300mP19_20760 [Dehalococcoidia bacterium]